MNAKTAIDVLQNADLAGVLREAADMAVSALQGGGGLELVLVVTVPAGVSADLGEVQRRIVREMEQRVLVLPEGYQWSVEHLPVRVEAVASTPPPKPLRPDEAREKQEILAQLKAYRAAKGLGCLGDLAKAVRRKDVTESLLRNALTGDAVLDMAQWRAIRKGLEKVEKRTEEVET